MTRRCRSTRTANSSRSRTRCCGYCLRALRRVRELRERLGRRFVFVRPRRDDPATLAAWRALPNFIAKEDFDGLESKKNYETVSKMKGFIGVLDNSWVVTWVPPSAGMKVLVR